MQKTAIDQKFIKLIENNPVAFATVAGGGADRT